VNSIEEEIKALVTFLSNPAGFSVDMAGQLSIHPIYGTIEHWEVDWEEEDEELIYNYHKTFLTLEEAAQCFVEKRRYMCLGLDFNKMALGEDKDE
jgi:hypothetical protein